MIWLLLTMTATQAPSTNPATYLALEVTHHKIRLADMQTRLQDEHPALVRKRRQIEVLEKAAAKQDGEVDQQLIESAITMAIVKAEMNLELLQIGLHETHLRVQFEKQRLANLKELRDADR